MWRRRNCVHQARRRWLRCVDDDNRLSMDSPLIKEKQEIAQRKWQRPGKVMKDSMVPLRSGQKDLD